MRLREFTPGDRNAVNAVHRQVWWRERSQAGWAWLDENPARKDIGGASGWVLENETGEAGAFVGNLIQRFWKGDQKLYAATGFSIIVPPEMKGGSRPLIQAFMEQPGVAAGYTLNANPLSHGIYRRRGFTAYPPGTDGLKLSWVVDHAVCGAGRLLRQGVDRWPVLAKVAGEAFMNRRLGRAPRDWCETVAVLDDLSEGSEYDLFWRTLRDEGDLICDRSPEVMRWRLSDPDQSMPPLLLAYRRDGRITGYAMAMLGKGNSIEPPCLEVLDIQALSEETEAVEVLMRCMIQRARSMGAAKVRLPVVNPKLLSRLGDLPGRARREGGWGHCLAVFRDVGIDFSGWSPTPFDGDYGVYTRPPPMRQSARAGMPAQAGNVRFSKA